MLRIKDIKIVLFCGYAGGYLLAVLPPLFIDPLLTSHVRFPLRHYKYSILCVLIYFAMLLAEYVFIRRAKEVKQLYLSVFIFIASILMSLPIFLPEFPHLNLFNAGSFVSALSAISIFIFSMNSKLVVRQEQLRIANKGTLEYLKEISTFVRQGFIVLVGSAFGVIVIGSYKLAIDLSQLIANDPADIFLLHANLVIHLVFHLIYFFCGPMRYMFLLNLSVLEQMNIVSQNIDKLGGSDIEIK